MRTYALSHTISELSQDIGEVIAFDKCLYVTPQLGQIYELWAAKCVRKARNITLLRGAQ